MNNSDINFNDVERQDMLDGDLDKEIQEEMLEEAKEEQAIFNKYYNMLTEEEKFDLAEEGYLDENSFDDYWYLKPKFVVESRRKKGENNE